MGFTVPQLKSCCCGCSIRTGTLIILWLYLISALLFSSNVIQTKPGADSHNKTAVDDGHSAKMNNTNAQPFQDIVLGVPPALDIIVTLVVVAVVIAGLYGTYQDKAAYLLPFVILYALTPLEALIRTFFLGSITLIGVFFGIIFIAIFLYLWLVVFSHYRNLRDNRSGLMA